MKKFMRVLVIIFLGSGCFYSGGSIVSPTNSTVGLNRANYRFLGQVSGSATSGNIFGFIPVGVNSYSEAMGKLHCDAQEKYEIEGTASQFINLTKDKWLLHFLIFQIKGLKISASVIRFEK